MRIEWRTRLEDVLPPSLSPMLESLRRQLETELAGLADLGLFPISPSSGLPYHVLVRNDVQLTLEIILAADVLAVERIDFYFFI